MRLPYVAALIGSVIVLGCEVSANLTPSQENVEREAIAARFADWTTAINNRQIDNILGMYDESENVRTVLPNGSLGVGQASGEAINNFYNTLQFLNFVPQNPAIEVLNATTALVSFRHSIDITWADSRREPFSGHGVMIWVKTGEEPSWNIHNVLLSRTR